MCTDLKRNTKTYIKGLDQADYLGLNDKGGGFVMKGRWELHVYWRAC